MLTDDIPPQLTSGRILTAWQFDPWLTLFVVVASGLYLWGVWRLHARGDRWPVGRTISFVVGGMGTIVIATMSVLGVYDDTLLSLHMIQHMVLSMVSPVFMALGAPVTLALRTLPRRPRAVLLKLLHSRLGKVVGFPLVSGAIFIATPFALYFTGWYRATLTNTYLHDATHLHFILVGCLWFWPLLGLDPVPGRLTYPFRLLAIFMTLPFHAILGLSIMQSTSLIGGNYYPGLHLAWADPFADQRAAGGILWGSGDLVGAFVFIVLAVQWMRASMREAEREDRRLDRLDEEARLAATREDSDGSITV
jgi:putative copper resistance protein D